MAGQKGIVRLDNADIFQWSKEEIGPHIGLFTSRNRPFPPALSLKILHALLRLILKSDPSRQNGTCTRDDFTLSSRI